MNKHLGAYSSLHGPKGRELTTFIEENVPALWDVAVETLEGVSGTEINYVAELEDWGTNKSVNYYPSRKLLWFTPHVPNGLNAGLSISGLPRLPFTYPDDETPLAAALLQPYGIYLLRISDDGSSASPIFGLRPERTADSLGLFYFSTSTADAHPGNGFLRLNTLTQANATLVRVPNIDATGTDVSFLLAQLTAPDNPTKGRLMLSSDEGPWARTLTFDVTERLDQGTYDNIVGSVHFATNPFSQGELLSLTFRPSGDKGEGVPVGGIAAQVLEKIDGTDFNTRWVTLPIPAMQSDITGLQAAVALLNASLSGSLIAKATYAELAAITPAANTTGEVEESDTGNHTDPVVGGTVPNTGRFTYSTSPAGWKRIGGLYRSRIATLTSIAGGPSAYTATDPNGPAAYSANLHYIYTAPATANAAGATLNVNSLGALPFQDEEGVAVAAGVLSPAGRRFELLCTGGGGAFRVKKARVDLEKISSFSPNDQAWAHRVTSENGETLYGFHRQLGFLYPDKNLAAWNAENLAQGERGNSRLMTKIPYLSRPYCLMASAPEQSFGQGAQAMPPITGTILDPDGAGAFDGAVTIGNDVRSRTSDEDDYIEMSPAGFQPAIAKGRLEDVLLTTEASWAANPEAAGQTPVMAFQKHLKQLLLQSRGVDTLPSRIFIPVCTGKGGQPLSALLPGAVPNIFGKFTDAVSLAAGYAGGGANLEVSAYLWLQGQSDQLGTGTATNRAEYKSQMYTWVNFADDHVRDVTGQKTLPLILLFIPDADYHRDQDPDDNWDAFVQMAMQEFYSENKHRCIVVGPQYQLSDKTGDHPDSNGEVQNGIIAAQKAARALIYRRSYEPLWLIRSRCRENVLDLHFNRRVKIGVPWRDGLPMNPATTDTWGNLFDWGIRVRDSFEWLSLSGLRFIQPTIIRGFLGKAPWGEGVVYLGAEQGGGQTLIRSADDGPDSLSTFTYAPGVGFYPSVNEPSLVDLPYDTAEFCVTGSYPLNWDRERSPNLDL